MNRLRTAICLAFAMGGAMQPAVALTPVEQALIDKARYWESRGRPDLAVESWQKLLQNDPNQPDALLGKGLYEARQGLTGEASKYLQTLRKNYPNHPGIAVLEQAIGRGKLDVPALNKSLETARRLAAAKRYDQAVAAYRQAFHGVKPSGGDALEYYLALAGTDSGWSEARSGIEQLVRENPGNSGYSLAYAKLLSYREATRREALGMLDDLTKDPSVAADARAAWRQALIWLDARQEDAKYYRQYLARTPQDQAVSDRLAQILRPPKAVLDPITIARMAAYRDLQGGKIEGAEASFRAMLRKDPNDSEAIAGLAVVNLRRQQFAQARDLFAQAMRKSPAKRAKWEQGYRTAMLWSLIDEAQAARRQGESAKAEKLLRQAQAYDTREHVVKSALADLLAERGDLAGAEAEYRMVLREQPANGAALKGLFSLMLKEGKTQQALAFISQLDPQQRAGIEDFGGLQNEILRAQAKQAESRGDLDGARRNLEDALLQDPSSVWTRLDLARVYQRQGDPQMARSVIDGLLAANPDQPDALYASALLSAEQKNWLEALVTMEKIPERARTAAMVATQRRAWVNAQAERAVVYQRQGNLAAARDALRKAQAAAGSSPELLGAVATGFAQIGDTAMALNLMRRLIGASQNPSAGLRLQYAGILLATGQDAELVPLLNQLSAQGAALSDSELQDLDNLRIALALRRADSLRERGDLAAAYDALAPDLDSHPDEPRLQLALSRLYSAAGDYSNSFSILRKVLDTDPDNLDVIQSAIGAAIDLKNYSIAEQLVARGLALAPDDPRINALAGRVARAQGRDEEAIDYFKKALMLERRDAGTDETGTRLVDQNPGVFQQRTAPSRNPFRGRSPVRPVLPDIPDLPPPGGAPRIRPLGFSDRQPTGAAHLDSARRIRSLASLENEPQSQAESPVRYAALDVPADADPVYSDIQPIRKAPREPVTDSSYADYPPARPTPRRVDPKPFVDAQPKPQPSSLQDEIDELRLKYSSRIGAGAALRNRSGESGMSQLLDVELPLSGEIHPGFSGTAKVSVVPVTLTAGDLNMVDPTVARRMGTNSLALPATVAPIAQNATGIALGFSYQLDSFKADIGTSPLGFAASNVVGGVRWEQKFDNGVSLGVEASRRSVTDSLLSYAGAKDPGTGAIWGAVAATGLHFDFGLDGDSAGLYLKAGYHGYTGRGVASNNQFDASAGGYWYAVRDDDTIVTVGGNITAQAFSKNLRYFTYGHGGYFSPQSYVSLSAPVDWTGRSGKLAYQLQTSLGIQAFREDAVAYFPNDPALQAQLQNLALLNPALITNYGAKSSSGFSYSLMGAIEYQVAPKVGVGGRISLDNASNYAQQSGLVYLRYSFLPQKGKSPLSQSPIKPYYLGEAP